MARATKAKKADPLREAAVDYFSSRSHNAWRKRLFETNPEQRGQPRMRLRGGVMVDINKPWSSLDPKAKADNKRAAYDAFDAVKRFHAAASSIPKWRRSTRLGTCNRRPSFSSPI